MSYKVYARKYRPVNFDEMIGQKHIVRTLQNAVQNHRVAQAYLFSGTRGIGKTTTARILAKALNCMSGEGPTPDPCNKCDACLQINEDRAVDVIEIDGASNTGVDDVRLIKEGVKYKPIYFRSKVIIIDEVHMLSKQAFNALLKTIEEPPPNTVFIFATTEFHKVPATIVSRCQHFEFKKISQKDIINHLIDIAKKENITISPIGLNLIAEASEGSMRDAQSLLDQAVAFSGENIKDEDLSELLGAVSRDILFEFSGAIKSQEADKVFSLIDTIIDRGYDLRYFYKELIQHFRSLLIVRTVKSAEDILTANEDDLRRLKKASAEMKPEEILRYITALQNSEQGMRFSNNPRIYLETTLVRLCHYQKLIPLENILHEIEKLKDCIGNREVVSSGKNLQARERTYPAAARQAPQNPIRENENPCPKEVKEQAESPRILKETKVENSEGRKPKRDTIIQDPTVISFMEKFKAQVLSVEEINKKER